MAIYHANLRVLSRSQGNSAVAAAAYRAGVALQDQRLGIAQDYSRKKGVEHTATFAPMDAPAWARDDAVLWNAAERAESRKNARVARELIIGLPHELPAPARQLLAERVALALVERYSVAVQLAVHAPDKRGDQRNHHAHLLMTTRVVTPSGMGKKIRVLDDKVTGPKEVEWIRAQLAELTNAALVAADCSERVDHRTLQVQAKEAEASGDLQRAARLTREPTRHVGRAGMALARRGRHDGKVAHNRLVVANNQAALAHYLKQAQAQGRLMPASHDLPQPAVTRTRRGSRNYFRGTRATGADAELLNGQMQQMEKNMRATELACEQYEAGLQESLRELNFLPPNPYDPAVAELQRALSEARRNLAVLNEQARRRREQYAQAKREREAHQLDDLAEAPKPAAWQVGARQRWEQVRRVRWAKLRSAIDVEREAREAADPKAMKALRQQAQKIKQEVARLDAALLAQKARPSKGSAEPVVGPTRPRPRTLN